MILPAVLVLFKVSAPLFAVMVLPADVCKVAPFAVILMSPLVVLSFPMVTEPVPASVKLPPELELASVPVAESLRLTTPEPPVLAESSGVFVVIAVVLTVPLPMFPVPEISVML